MRYARFIKYIASVLVKSADFENDELRKNQIEWNSIRSPLGMIAGGFLIFFWLPINVSGVRDTGSVCDGHGLWTFAELCSADSKPTFFAGTKPPSTIASQISISPRPYWSSASFGVRIRKIPCQTHCWSCRRYVCRSRSFPDAPFQRVHKIGC